MGVFSLSYILWNRLGQRSKQLRLARKVAVVSHSPLQAGSGGGRAWCSTSRDKQTGRQAGCMRQPPTSREPSCTEMKATEAQMLKHLELREFTRALNMYRALERSGCKHNFSEELYASFIQSAVRVGKMDVVEHLLQAVRRSGLAPSVAFWQTTLRMLSSRKCFTVCLSVHRLFGRRIPADKTVFSCLINAALEAGSPELARDMLGRYAEADKDLKDHVLFFRAYVALKDVDSAEAMFRKLGRETTSLMLNLLLLCCVTTGQADRSLKLLREAHELEKEEGALEKPIVDVVSYNTVIKGFAQAGSPSLCFKCLHDMTERGMQPDDITFGSLLDACIENDSMNTVSKVVDLFLESNREIGTVMSTLLIKALVKANCLPKALELCDEMRRRAGARPDVVTYSVLIKAHVDQHELDRALMLVKDMAEAGHAPDDIILTHLLEGCRYVGNHELGKKLFTEMLANGVKPSDYTLVAMLKLHGRMGAHQEAHDLVSGWEAMHGSKPSVIHYTCLMSGSLRTKSYDLAWEAYELMRSNGVEPDTTTLSTLLPGMASAQQWERVVALVRRAVTPSRCNVPREMVSSSFLQMQAAGAPSKHTEELRVLMSAAGITVTQRNSRRSVAR